jgi:hypothetical protein
MKHLNITFITFAMISPLNDLNYRFSYIPHTHIIPHITLISFVFVFVFVLFFACWSARDVHGNVLRTFPELEGGTCDRVSQCHSYHI